MIAVFQVTPVYTLMPRIKEGHDGQLPSGSSLTLLVLMKQVYVK